MTVSRHIELRGRTTSTSVGSSWKSHARELVQHGIHWDVLVGLRLSLGVGGSSLRKVVHGSGARVCISFGSLLIRHGELKIPN